MLKQRFNISACKLCAQLVESNSAAASEQRKPLANFGRFPLPLLLALLTTGFSLPLYAASQLGAYASLGLYNERTFYRLPAFAEKPQRTELEKEALLLQAGLSAGPYTFASLELASAYHYQQEWYSEAPPTQEVYNQSSLGLFDSPLPARHLEREHNWQLAIRTLYAMQWEGGFWQELKMRKAGSKYLSEQSPLMTNASYRVSDQIVTLPWISYHWQENHQSWLIVYLYKNYQHLLPDEAMQTYSLGGSDKFLSLIGAHRWQPSAVPQLESYYTAAALRIRANDLWQELRRRSVSASVSYQAWPNLQVSAHAYLYRDTYLTSYLEAASDPQYPPTHRERIDSGLGLGGKLCYDLSPSWQVGASFAHWKNQSPGFRDKEFTRNNAMMTLSMALPHGKTSLAPFWLREDEFLQKRLEINAIK